MKIVKSAMLKLSALTLLLALVAPGFAQTPVPASDDGTVAAGTGEGEAAAPNDAVSSAATSGNEVAAASAQPLPTIPLPAASPEAPPVVEEAAADDGITEIVVTATKREKSVRDLPVSIDAISGESLEKMGARDVQDYIATVPGITLQDDSSGDAGGRKITVRGVGPSSINGVSGNQTVGQFIGDFPMTDPYSNFVTPDLDPFDLQDVEILKGPQGTYFGASALNGAIRYVPTKPQLSRWVLRGFSEAMSITDGGMEGTYAAALNIPVGDTFAARATGVLQNTPGYIDNLQTNDKDADSRRKWTARGALRWQPWERLDINLMYLKQKSDRNDVLDIDNDNGALTNNSHPGPSSLETGFDLASIDARYDTDGWGTIVWQSSLQHKNSLADLDSTLFTGSQGIPNFRSYAKADIKGTTHELRLVSPDGGDWTWIAGAFFQDYSADVFTDAYLPGTALPPQLPSLPILDQFIGPRGLSYGTVQTSPDARETSLYGELTRRLWSDWELTVGARLYRTQVKGTSVIEGLLGVLAPDADIDQHDKGISPKFSLSYKPSKSLMVYATVARGFQFGGINTNVSGLPFDNPLTGPPVPPTFKSSSLWSREIGIRTDWLHRTLRADLTLYDLDWSDAQFVERNDNLLIDTDYVSNVGKVRSRGVESSLIYLTPLKGLSVNVAAGYSRAKTASSYTAQNGTEVSSGTEMPNSPHWQVASTLAYDRPFGNWLVGGTFTHTYTSRAYDTILHDHDIFDYNAFNLGLSLARPDLFGEPALSFTVTNLADKRGVVGRSSSTGVSGVTGSETPSYIFIRPRTYVLRLSFQFE